MDLLFTVQVDPVPETPTVIDTNIVDHYPTLNANTTWQVFKPFVRQATQKRLLPYLGKTLYGVLIAADADPVNVYADAIEQLRDACAGYTIARALPKLLTVIGEAGIGQNVSEKFQNTNQWSYKNTLWDATRDADAALDVALQLLEEIDTAEVLAWKTTSNFQQHRPNWLSSLSSFEQHHNLMGSRRTYIALVPYIEKAIDRFLLPITGKGLELRLRTNDPVTPHQAEATRKIEAMLAAYTIYLAVPNLVMVIEGDGFKTVSQVDGYDQKTNITSAVAKEATIGLRTDAERTAKRARADLQAFLVEHQADLPEYLTSPSYSTPHQKQVKTARGAMML